MIIKYNYHIHVMSLLISYCFRCHTRIKNKREMKDKVLRYKDVYKKRIQFSCKHYKPYNTISDFYCPDCWNDASWFKCTCNMDGIYCLDCTGKCNDCKTLICSTCEKSN